MRQVSGSAVQGLEGVALRLDRLPEPRGFILLSQLILDSAGGCSKVTGTQRQEIGKKCGEEDRIERKVGTRKKYAQTERDGGGGWKCCKSPLLLQKLCDPVLPVDPVIQSEANTTP